MQFKFVLAVARGTFFLPLFKYSSLDDDNENLLFLRNLRRGVMGCGFSLFLSLLLKTASAFGDPHFFTFDGLNFTFKGQGEYTLVESDLTSLRVQGRAQQARFPNGKSVREEVLMTSNSLICTSQHSSYPL